MVARAGQPPPSACHSRVGEGRYRVAAAGDHVPMALARRFLLRFGSSAGSGGTPEGPPPITLGRAIEIARTRGLVRATEAVCDDRAWDIEGFDASGREIAVEIDPQSGRVLRVARGG